jgi:hypothetical protein
LWIRNYALEQFEAAHKGNAWETKKKCSYCENNYGTKDALRHYLQGQSWQTEFFKLALRDGNMQVRFI